MALHSIPAREIGVGFRIALGYERYIVEAVERANGWTTFRLQPELGGHSFSSSYGDDKALPVEAPVVVSARGDG